jgi:hypothetical protein
MRSVARKTLSWVALAASLALAACLDPAPTGGGSHGPMTAHEAPTYTQSPQSADPSPMSSPDLGSSPTSGRDFGGLTDCFGVAICDPTMQFCIKFYSGSQAAPGALTNPPACFAPSDTCANQGQNMDCGCIQADPQLGPSCQGACVDNGDGTYSCYAS